MNKLLRRLNYYLLHNPETTAVVKIRHELLQHPSIFTAETYVHKFFEQNPTLQGLKSELNRVMQQIQENCLQNLLHCLDVSDD